MLGGEWGGYLPKLDIAHCLAWGRPVEAQPILVTSARVSQPSLSTEKQNVFNFTDSSAMES